MPSENIWDQRRAYFYLATLVVYFLSFVFKSAEFQFIVSILALGSLLISLPASRLGAKVLAVLSFVAGYWILINADVPHDQYVLAHGSMLPLLALFAVLPILSVPVELGNYGDSIQTVLRARISSVFYLNCVVTMFAFLCGSFMSLAAIPIMMTSMAPVVKHYPLRNEVRFRSVSATYGYVLPILWTPVSGVVGIVVKSLDLKWTSLLPLLVAMSIAALFMNWAVFYWLESRTTSSHSDVALPELSRKPLLPSLLHLSQILLAVFVMVVAVGLLDKYSQMGMMSAVSVVAIPFAFFWSLAIKKGPAFGVKAKVQMRHQLSQMSDQFSVFLAIGFFVTALNLSGLNHQLNSAFLYLHQMFGTTSFLLLMPFMAMSLAMVGVHPVIAIALLGESLKPAVLGIEPVLLAVTLIGSAVFTYMLGPFGGTLGLMQTLTRIPSYRLALWNLPYALAYFFILASVIVFY
jgi:hypothetical protein